MNVYRFTWGVVTALVLVSCGAYDLASGGSVRLAVLGPVMAAFGALLAFVFAEERPDRWVWVWRAGLWLGLGAVMADALVATLGGLGVVVGTLLLLTSPALVRTARTQFLAWSTRRSAGPPEALATRDLMRRWDWTTSELMRGSTSVARRLALAEERRGLLDEIQRRDPGHFDAWVAAALPNGSRDRSQRGGDHPWRRGW